MKLKLSTINILSLCVFVVIALLLSGSAASLNHAIKTVGRTVAVRAELRQQAMDFARMSDLLTDEARKFVVTGDMQHLLNYWDEANTARHRDKIIQRVRELDVPREELNLLIISKKNSDALMYTETLAMRLKLESMGVPEKKMHPSVASLALPVEYRPLAPADQARKARDLMFDIYYQESKDNIMAPLFEFQQVMFARTSTAVAEAQRVSEERIRQLYYLSAFILLMVMVLLALFYAQVFRPVSSYTNHLRASGENGGRESLTPDGVAEVRLLAEAFNQHTQEIRRSEERFHALVANIPGIVYRSRFDKDFTMIDISRSVENIIGYPRADFIGNRVRSFASVIHPDDAGQLFEKVRKYLKDGEISAMEFRVIRSDAQVCWMSAYQSPIYDSAGEIAEISGVFFDITDRKETQLELRSKLKAIQALYGISNFVFLHSGNSIDTMVNGIMDFIPQALVCTDKAAVRVILEGKTYARSVVNESALLVSTDITINNQQIGALEIAAEGRVGGSALPQLSHDERAFVSTVAELLGVVVENTRIRAEVNKLIKAIEQSSSSVVITDTAGNIEYTNTSFLTLTGYSKEEVMGANPRILKTDYHSREYYEHLWETISSGKVWKGNFHNRKKSGETYWEIATISPVSNEDGKVVNYVAVKDDITLQKRMEEKLQESIETKSRFLSIVSHELRTPLAAIKEGIALVYDGEAGQVNPEQKGFLEVAMRNVDRLHRLINEVLDFAKMESGRMEYHIKESDINQAVNEAAAGLKSSADAKGLSLAVHTDPSLAPLPFDHDRIVQVITNLVNNAIKFTAEGGITVSCARDEETGGARVTVEDTGIGIAADDIPKLFFEFQQLATNDRKTGSTGLGLAICKEIVEKHKGRIWAEPGSSKGAKFVFTIPA